MTLETFDVHPERWWLARRGDMPWLTDPGDQRHPDRNERDWPSIAHVIQAAADAIADGEDTITLDLAALGTAAVYDPAEDDDPDRCIVRSWFTRGIEPWSDPGDAELGNGRHRLWATWEAAPDALLPIYSYVLATPSNPGSAHTALEVLHRLPPELGERNPRYVKELRRVGRRGRMRWWWSRLIGG